MVRNNNTKPHQGWDLFAEAGTKAYAVADGVIGWADPRGDFGNLIVLEFSHNGEKRYAAYAHLESVLVKVGESVKRGDVVGLTGNSGNAASMTGADQHLHFEIRTALMPGKGLSERLDPVDLYGRVPIGCTVLETHNDKKASGCS